MKLLINDFYNSWELDDKTQISRIISTNYGGFNLFYISYANQANDYPLVSILVNAEKANVNFNSDGDSSFNAESFNYSELEGETLFKMSEVESGDYMPNRFVIPLEKALEIVEYFYDSSDRPECVNWKAL